MEGLWRREVIAAIIRKFLTVKNLYGIIEKIFQKEKAMNSLITLAVIMILVSIIVIDSSDCLCNALWKR